MTNGQFAQLLAAVNTFVFEQRAILAEEREQTEQLRQLRVDLAEQRSAGDLRLSLLLRAVRAALGSDQFTAAELVELVQAKLSTRIALHAAVQAVVGSTRHPAKSLGHFLRNNAGSTADGLRLVRVRGSVCRIETVESREVKTWPSLTKGRP